MRNIHIDPSPRQVVIPRRSNNDCRVGMKKKLMISPSSPNASPNGKKNKKKVQQRHQHDGELPASLESIAGAMDAFSDARNLLMMGTYIRHYVSPEDNKGLR